MKSEPESFSIDDLAKAPKKTTCWDGVRNYQARNFMRSMEIGGTPPDDFEGDRRQLITLIERFTAQAKDVKFCPHPFFGDMSEDQWMRWGYLHCNHHLKQFGA